jgi:hypothetical protein
MYKCFKCEKIAVWYYAPDNTKDHKDNSYYCDDCISRGCSCNIDPNTKEEIKDEQGRLFPCCEYIYNKYGFNQEMKIQDRYGTELIVGDFVSVYQNEKEIIDKAKVIYISGQDHIYLHYDKKHYNEEEFEIHNGYELIKHLDERDFLKIAK